MRLRSLIAVCLLLCTALPAHASHGGVHITEILPDPGTGREFVELHNAGDAVDVTGWTISDTAGNTYTFNTTLAASARLVLWGGGEPDARGPAWSKSTVWNNGGDQVFLHDAAGTLVDSLAYGSAAWPDGRSDPVPPAPATGSSLALHDTQWIEGSPTPGSAPQSDGGSATATVADVPPSIAFIAVPAEVAPGETFQIDLSVSDDNGDADVAAWRVEADAVTLANGTAAGDHTITLTAPSDRDTWNLLATAIDAGGQNGTATASVAIRAAGLVLLMPPSGLHFPAFPPGAAEVVTDASFTLRNDGDTSVTPRIDVSDLGGPATIPVAGRLDIGNATWTPYDGPLTELPALAPGESIELHFRLRDLPSPLPAGDYGTSFTVVA